MSVINGNLSLTGRRRGLVKWWHEASQIRSSYVAIGDVAKAHVTIGWRIFHRAGDWPCMYLHSPLNHIGTPLLHDCDCPERRHSD